MDVTALLLADSRFPGGGHVHSGGLEEAAARGLVRTEDDLPAFLRGRLRTAGALAAVVRGGGGALRDRGAGPWPLLDVELDARTPSAAQRAASRAQGRATARAARSACGRRLRSCARCWPITPRPHHPIVLGALVGTRRRARTRRSRRRTCR